jgi:PPE-repeat protein
MHTFCTHFQWLPWVGASTSHYICCNADINCSKVHAILSGPSITSFSSVFRVRNSTNHVPGIYITPRRISLHLLLGDFTRDICQI